MTWIKQKFEALVDIQQYIATVERQTSHKVNVSRSDKGGVYFEQLIKIHQR
jgi:hypothetical protein